MVKRYSKWILCICLMLLATYGLGRLYYRVTGGFTLGNIAYELPQDLRREIEPLKQSEKENLNRILSQPFHYLGKGCQSYVFKSDDGRYVLKFFKYQRLRPQAWLDWFAVIPWVDTYRLGKIEKKKQKLQGVFTSWKIAYEELQPETGVVYIHLNKEPVLGKPFLLHDKMGFKHTLNLDQYEFLLQRKADMLCPILQKMVASGDMQGSKELLDRLLTMIQSEYTRGFADNDHALMQNTGVLDGQPVHIDVGQFVKNSKVNNPLVYNQEIFNKTWKFRKWLEKESPELADHLVMRLKEIMGKEPFAQLKPRLNKATMGIIPNE